MFEKTCATTPKSSTVTFCILKKTLQPLKMHAILETIDSANSARLSEQLMNDKKVKFSHTSYRALGPELIPVYRQSACR